MKIVRLPNRNRIGVCCDPFGQPAVNYSSAGFTRTTDNEMIPVIQTLFAKERKFKNKEMIDACSMSFSTLVMSGASTIEKHFDAFVLEVGRFQYVAFEDDAEPPVMSKFLVPFVDYSSGPRATSGNKFINVRRWTVGIENTLTRERVYLGDEMAPRVPVWISQFCLDVHGSEERKMSTFFEGRTLLTLRRDYKKRFGVMATPTAKKPSTTQQPVLAEELFF